LSHCANVLLRSHPSLSLTRMITHPHSHSSSHSLHPTPTLADYQQVADLLGKARTVFMTVHVNPDGDTLGSMLALRSALITHYPHIEVLHVAMEGKKPDIYHRLPGIDVVLQSELHQSHYLNTYDMSLSFDCGSKARLGFNGQIFDKAPIRVNLDHHVSNERFGTLNLVDVELSATGQVVAHLIDAMKVPFTREIAVNLYAALMTDTGNFKYPNSTPEVFELAKRLTEAGAEGHLLYRDIYEETPLCQLKLMGRVIERTELICQGAIAHSWVSPEDLESLNACEEHTEGGIDVLRQLKGVQACAFFKENTPNLTKISFRSLTPRIDVSHFAEHYYQGGGHTMAAGCSVKGTRAEVMANVLPKLEAYVTAALAVAQDASLVSS
jgi:phosphoesterase RecJ-like protein